MCPAFYFVRIYCTAKYPFSFKKGVPVWDFVLVLFKHGENVVKIVELDAVYSGLFT